MNALASYYVSLILVVLAVLSNRYWHRQLKKTREKYETVKRNAEDVTRQMGNVARECTSLASDLSALTKRADKANKEYEYLEAELGRRKAAPMERYHIIDRSEPRSGAFWEVAIRCTGTSEADYVGRPYWPGVKTYLVIADSDVNAARRAQTKFPLQTGYQVVQAVPCRITGLAISRLDGVPTARKSSDDASTAAMGNV